MSKEKSAFHKTEVTVYAVQGRKFIVTPVYKKDGENVCDILLKLICMDEDETRKQA